MIQLARLSLKTCISAALLMVAAAALAIVATPRLQSAAKAPDLESTVPQAFGDWKSVKLGYAQVDVSQGVETSVEQPYDQTVMRSYANSHGDVLMLALAWGERQRQDVKVHRPEVCYPAQGYAVLALEPGKALQLPGRAVPVPTVNLLSGARGGVEAVRYWIRIGDNYGGDGLKARWYILNEGLQGRIPDGILVRVSQRIQSPADAPKAYALMDAFLTDLTGSLPPRTLAMLVR